MGQTNMSRDEAVERLDAALGELEQHLTTVFPEGAGQGQPAALQRQIEALIRERDRLSAELDAERARVLSLKTANREVSGRLAAVLGTLKDMVPAMPG